MSFPVKPCAHCGNLTFHFIPNMQLDVAFARVVFGVAASQEASGRHWTFTLVVCSHCGSSQTFTTNPADLLKWVPGASTATMPQY
jgi:hypothetical protein